MTTQEMLDEIYEMRRKRALIESIREDLKANPMEVVNSLANFWWERKIESLDIK